MPVSGPIRRTRRVRPGYRPTLDTFEARQLLTTVTPFLQGTVFNDSNGDGSRDATEAPLAGATISLYAANATTPVATTTSGADGGYVFDGGNVPGGLAVGATYTLVESAAGYSSTGAQALSQVNPAAVTAPNAIRVTVVDPNSIVPSLVGPVSYATGYDRVAYTFNGSSHTVLPTQLNFSLVGGSALGSSSLTALCVGVNDRLDYNTPFPTVIDPQSALPNGGQIAYLYNHYGIAALSPSTPLPAALQGLATKNVAAGLQLAVWQLEYGNAFALSGYDPAYTSAQDYGELQAATAAFLADAAGKSEKVAVLDASLTGVLPTDSVTPGSQSILAAMSYDFGARAIPVGSLSGVVYGDCNNNGIREAGEAGIGGIAITLVDAATGATTSTRTGADGSYAFANLAPGTYSVVEGATPGYLPSRTNTGSLAGVAVTSGADTPNNNFGEVRPGSISGIVYADKTGDGLSGDDKAMAGVTVQLVNSSNVVVATMISGKDGSYSFAGLLPGTYTVREVVPTGYAQTGPSGLTYTVPLACGQDVANENFDNYQVTCSCSIGCISYTVVGACGTSTYSSLGGNTDQGDQVTVNFTVGGNAPQTVSFVTYTATSNFDLTRQAIFSVATQTFAPGQHSLTVTIPNSYYQIDFVCGAAIARFDPAANITYHGQGRFIDADRGGSEAAPAAFASLSGSVFADDDADGVFDAKEAGLGGVTVRLTGKDLNGKSVSLTRITAKDGSYSFAGLQPGTYSVKEATPTGYSTTKNSVGTAGGTLSSDTIGAITLAGGTVAAKYNFGERAVGNPLGCNQTASAGFWNGCYGQSLIKSLNGGSNSKALGNWLAAQFPNSLSCLAGKTNAQVASFYQSSYAAGRSSSLTEGLATALAVYATDSDLAGVNCASCYGLKVTSAGAGVATVDVGNTFACYGGPTGKVTLMQLLRFADGAGGCDAWLQYRLACVFDAINGCGTC